MAPKKAAKKAPGKHVAKKVAKKAAKKTAKLPASDLRRAYEHLHRLRSMQRFLTEEALESVDVLSRAAQAALAADDSQSAADLLRAAEHLAFGTLAADTEGGSLGEMLIEAFLEEYKRLREREKERHEDREDRLPKRLRQIRKALVSSAKQARKEKSYARALEFARGAEALSHARTGQLRLEDDSADATRALLE